MDLLKVLAEYLFDEGYSIVYSKCELLVKDYMGVSAIRGFIIARDGDFLVLGEPDLSGITINGVPSDYKFIKIGSVYDPNLVQSLDYMLKNKFELA